MGRHKEMHVLPSHLLKLSNNQKMKKTLIAFCAICSTYALHAQEKGHNLFINAGGGFHQISYQLNNGNLEGGVGFSLNAGYSYFFNKNWGFSTGIGMQSFNSEATLNFTTKTPDIDAERDAYELRTHYNGWKEEQSTLLFDIPLTINFRQSLNRKVVFTTSFGGKFSIPAVANYKAKGGTITTTGYYSQWNVELSDLPEQGYTTYSNQPSGNLSLQPAISILGDIGIAFQLKKTVQFYTGVYASYGLNSMLKADSKSIYIKDGTYNGLFASSLVKDVRPIAAGIKIGLIWNILR
jgi:hypothetical protein